MSIFKKNEHETFTKELAKIREKIPKKYNQVRMLDYLDDPDVDLMFSITTRSDGKTFNYLYALARLNEDLGISTCIVVRHMEIRNAMVSQIQDMYDTMPDFNVKLFSMNIQMDFIAITYGEKMPFVICDLNNANDLKNYSSVLRKCSLILYDEFLAVGGEYTNDEFAKWKVIFETMDRGKLDSMKYTNGLRKGLFLGNPVDFSSEFLAQYKLYPYLDRQEMNTVKKYHNIVIERFKNENGQTDKNNRIFSGIDNESITGEFHINDWQIADPRGEDKITIVKTQDKFIEVHIEDRPVLDVVANESDYDYNTELVDNTDKSIYLKDKYYKEDFSKKYVNKKYAFANQFSKTYILTNYPTLNFDKIIRESKPLPNTPTTPKQDEEELERIRISNIKRSLARQYL